MFVTKARFFSAVCPASGSASHRVVFLTVVGKGGNSTVEGLR